MPVKFTKDITFTSGTRQRAIFICCGTSAAKWDSTCTIIPRCGCVGRMFRAAISASCFPKDASAARATCYSGRSAFFPPPGAGADMGRSTPSRPSICRTTRSSFPNTVSISRVPASAMNALTQSLMLGTVRRLGIDSFAIESHLLKFHPIQLSADTEVELHFLDRLRDEIKFPSVDALKEQIGRDVRKSQKYFRRLSA